MSAARATTVVDDERVRVTTLTFDAIGDGAKHELAQQAGSPYLGQADIEHDVANVGAPAATFVEIELKR